MTDAPKLKPCPFCGGGIITIEGKGQLWHGQSYGDPQYYQLDHFGKLSETDDFPRCRVEFRCRTEAEAIAAWNTRADLIDMDVLRRVEAVITRQHTWHLAQTDPVDMGGVEIVPAEAYAESGIHDATVFAIADLQAMMEKMK